MGALAFPLKPATGSVVDGTGTLVARLLPGPGKPGQSRHQARERRSAVDHRLGERAKGSSRLGAESPEAAGRRAPERGRGRAFLGAKNDVKKHGLNKNGSARTDRWELAMFCLV